MRAAVRDETLSVFWIEGAESQRLTRPVNWPGSLQSIRTSLAKFSVFKRCSFAKDSMAFGLLHRYFTSPSMTCMTSFRDSFERSSRAGSSTYLLRKVKKRVWPMMAGSFAITRASRSRRSSKTFLHSKNLLSGGQGDSERRSPTLAQSFIQKN